MSTEVQPRWPVPPNWAWATLSQLGDVVGGGTPSTKEPSYWGDEINWISPSDLTGYSSKTIRKGRKGISRLGLDNSSAKVMPAGSVHFSSRAPVGHVVISSEPTATNQGFKSLIPSSGILNAYVYYYLIASREYARSRASGTTFLELSGKAFGELAIPVAPTNVQHAIVSKLEELFSELDAGIKYLKKARARLATYRQSVLKYAFEGRLTTKWREENKDILETPEKTIASIKKQRSARYEKQNRNWQTAVEVWKEGATGRRRPAKPRRPQDIVIAHTISEVDAPSLLPYGWRWVRLCNIAEVSGGLTKNPKRNALPRKMRYLRVANVYADGILTDDVHKIGVTEEETRSVVLEPGDLLVVEGNGSIEQIGRVAMWQGELHDCGHQNHLIRVRMATEHDPRFVLRFLLSPLGRELITNEASSTSGLHTLSISKVGNLPVPVASIVEEAEVVFQIDHKLSIVDKLADEIEVQLAKSETLRQSILQRAFSGQLVHQDETDQGAFVLLDQIRAEREQLTERARRRKTAK